jgi:hypothetical protein
VNRFDAYVTLYLYENKEVALEKIGTLKTSASGSDDAGTASVNFAYDRKIATTEKLVDFISEKTAKNRYLIKSDLESHFSQVREFINIGKSYEIPEIGFIKANKSGVYEFLPYSDINKPARSGIQPVKRQKQNTNRSFIQVITFLIVIAILAGLGWQAYLFFTKTKANNAASNTTNNHIDTTANATLTEAVNNRADTTAAPVSQKTVADSTDTINVRYIFETTASGLRARTRTAQLEGFGNNAGYDSFVTNSTKFYSLYILKPTRIADTSRIKDSLSKFFLKDIKLEVEQRKQ